MSHKKRVAKAAYEEKVSKTAATTDVMSGPAGREAKGK